MGRVDLKEINMTAYSSEDEPINSERASTSINKTNAYENSMMTRNLIPPELSNENRPGSVADISIKSLRKNKTNFQSIMHLGPETNSSQAMSGAVTIGRPSPGKKKVKK